MVVQIELGSTVVLTFVGPGRFILLLHGSICTTSNFKSKSSALTYLFFENNSITSKNGKQILRYARAL